MGFTEEEVTKYFNEHLNAIAQRRNITKEEVYQELRSWYRGYHFSFEEKAIYNPYSILRYLQFHKPGQFWTESLGPSTTALLQELVKEYPAQALQYLRNNQQNYYDPAILKLDSASDYSPERNKERSILMKLMVQTGCFSHSGGDLDYRKENKIHLPNTEVQNAFRDICHTGYFRNVDLDKLFKITDNMEMFLRSLEMEKFVAEMNAYMSMVPQFPVPKYWKEYALGKYNDTDLTLPEYLWFNFEVGLKLTGLFDSREWTYPTGRTIVGLTSSDEYYYSYDLPVCYVFLLMVSKEHLINECEELETWLNKCYSLPRSEVPVVCAGIILDVDSRKILDYVAGKFLTRKTFEMIELIYDKGKNKGT